MGCGCVRPPVLDVAYNAGTLPNFRLRRVLADESTLVFSFLYLAARMDEAKEPIQKALEDEHLSRYWKGWGRDGDLGIVAVHEDGLPVSCAWARLYSREEASWGFVADGIPELATGTVDGYRGQGVGTATLSALLDVAREHFPGLSLSVRETNPAVRLYERLGFTRVPGSEMRNRAGSTSFNMLVRFPPPGPR